MGERSGGLELKYFFRLDIILAQISKVLGIVICLLKKQILWNDM